MPRFSAPVIRLTLRVPAPRRPSRRAVAAVSAAAALLSLGYVGARETSLFAVRAIDVRGAPTAVEADVRRALAGVEGRSLVALDAAALEARLLAVPSVRFAHVDRAFPDSLSVTVRPERPLVVVRNGPRAWLVAESGRVIRPVDARARRNVPRVHLPASGELRPGGTLAEPTARRALTVLRALPRRFPRVVLVKAETPAVSLIVAGWVEVRLGSTADAAAKLAAAGAVLRSLPPEERTALRYLDASVPARVVASTNPQPETES